MSPKSPSPIRKALFVGADEVLNQTRAGVLQTAGWHAEATRNKQHAMALLKSEEFDLLLICHTITASSRPEFIEEFRKRNPNGKIVSFAGSAERERVDGKFSSSRPEDMIAFVKELFGD